MTLTVSSRAIDLIVGFEVSSEANYRAQLEHPTWPGGDSGVTIGIGEDLGYTTGDAFHMDWWPWLDRVTTLRLSRVCGMKGEPAKYWRNVVADVVVPWDAAIGVFKAIRLPRTIGYTAAAFPNCDLLNDDARGALVSLVYNRGPLINDSDRRLEMRQIRDAMAEKRFRDIPGYIRDMKRLWPTVAGLVRRRGEEASLFEAGLRAMAPAYTHPELVPPPVAEVTADDLNQRELDRIREGSE